jgi:hypothetical protein
MQAADFWLGNQTAKERSSLPTEKYRFSENPFLKAVISLLLLLSNSVQQTGQ